MRKINLNDLIKENILLLKNNCTYRLNDSMKEQILKLLTSRGYTTFIFSEQILRKENRFILIWSEKEIFNEDINDLNFIPFAFALALALPFAFTLAFTLALTFTEALVDGKLYNITDNIEFLDEINSLSTETSCQTRHELELYDD